MNLDQELRILLTEWQPGRVMRTAYDTAWVARLGEIDPVSNAALNWICEHQLPDGCWGASVPYYYHDRVISTLAAMTALCRRGRRRSDQKQIDAGLLALENITNGATGGLMADPNGATAGFETIVPTLIAEAESLGIIKCQGHRILGRLSKQRSAKLKRLNGFPFNRYLSIAFSAEMAGPDHLEVLDLDNLQEANGSIAYNPSSTAYYALHARPGDPKALAYLRSVVDEDGGAPIASPFDVYERAWVLWNLGLPGVLEDRDLALCVPHLDALYRAWVPGKGAGFGTGYSIQDGDDTSLAFSVLRQFGYNVDSAAVQHFEETTHFRCFDLEVNPSISTNVHFLNAFQLIGLEKNHPSVQKILNFLRENRNEECFWLDKWHVSPYYTSSHVVIACKEYDMEIAEATVDWILKMQRRDGSWGYYLPTAEETAYALQALVLWKQAGKNVPGKAIQSGADWLLRHIDPPYPVLWIAKTLYYSEWVIRAEILSALKLASIL